MKNDYMCKANTVPLRGIFAFLIMMHHIPAELPVVFIFMRYIGFILVGMFLFFSGYGLSYGYENKEKFFKNFISNKLITILTPYLIFSVIFSIFYFISFKFSFVQEFSGMWKIFSLRTIPQMWFIRVIIIFYLMYFNIFKLCIRKEKILILYPELFMIIQTKLWID